MPSSTRWTDVLLLLAGLAFAIAGRPEVGAPVALLGLLMPLLTWRAGRAGRGRALYRHVPSEVAAAHRDVLTAAARPGVAHAGDAVDDADDALLEVAALLGGRPPRGASQRRFVAARVTAMVSSSDDLRERHQLWTEATAEVDAIGSPVPPAEESRGGVLVTVFVALLFPLFLGWDLVRGVGRAVVGFVEGLALRVRTAGRLVVQAVASLGGLVVSAFRAWASVRDRVVESAREAHHRVAAARLRMRLRFRRARRIARRA